MDTINWYTKKFEDLSPHELYAVLQLRTEVFVVEQQCIFQDMDGKDEQCLHLMGWDQNQLLACTRLVPAGVAYSLPSIGRVVTAPAARGRGIGRLLMQKSINEIYTLFGISPIRIGAQLYLFNFYTELGFKQTSEVYLEDGIEHIDMVLD